MTPAMVSGITQTLPQLSTGKSKSSSQDETRTVSPNAGVVSIKDNSQAPVDTVSLSNQSRQAISGVKKEQLKNEEAKMLAASNEEASKGSVTGISDRTIAKVQFVYDMKGDLSMRYMDTSNRLVYQVPSELMLRLKESIPKSDSSVDTTA